MNKVLRRLWSALFPSGARAEERRLRARTVKARICSCFSPRHGSSRCLGTGISRGLARKANFEDVRKQACSRGEQDCMHHKT